MRLEAWRIVKAKHAASAFSGEGAARAGGRWNSPGVPVVYASATRSLAALETLVHLVPLPDFAYKIIRIEFDQALMERLVRDALPPDWRSEPPPGSAQRMGDAWARGLKSAILAVPSAIIPEEWNYLINPSHSDFPKITTGEPADFAFDSRLLERP